MERGTICVNTLPKDDILKYGQYWFRTQDPWVVSPTPYHCATEAKISETRDSEIIDKVIGSKFWNRWKIEDEEFCILFLFYQYKSFTMVFRLNNTFLNNAQHYKDDAMESRR